MRSIFTIFLLVVLAGCGGGSDGGSGGNGSSTPKPGFYFSFDSTGSLIVDDSGNGHNANPTSLSRVPGKKGTAIKFLTSGSVLEVNDPYTAFPKKEILTVMAWVKTDHAFSVREQIIGGYTGGEPGVFYPINNFGVSLIDNRLSFEVSSNPGMLSLTSDKLPIVPNEWFHVAVTYNGDTLKFYFNGQLINQGSILSTFSSSLSNQIGHNYHVYGGIKIVDQFYGYLDELYVDNRVYSDAELINYYNSTK